MFKIISIDETQFFCNGCGEVFVWEFNTPDKKPPKDWDGWSAVRWRLHR